MLCMLNAKIKDVILVGLKSETNRIWSEQELNEKAVWAFQHPHNEKERRKEIKEKDLAASFQKIITDILVKLYSLTNTVLTSGISHRTDTTDSPFLLSTRMAARPL